MAKKQFKDIKQGDKIISYGEKFVVKKIEFSGQGLKKGRPKCRIEAQNEKTGETKVIIRLVDEYTEVA